MDTSPDRPAIADGAFFAPLAAETRFYLVRHGQSEGNAKSLIQGRLDFPLDGAGRIQARAAGEWLAAQDIDSILSSPLARASETARIIASICGKGAPSLFDALAELDTGMFSGLTLDQAKERFPDSYAEFEYRSWDGVPDAESSSACYARAMDAWTLLRECARGGDRAIACVTHGGFIQWLVRSTFGCRSWIPLLPTGNCGIFELLVVPTGRGRPAYLQWRRLNFQPAASVVPIAPVF